MKIIITENQFTDIVKDQKQIYEQGTISNTIHTAADMVSMGFDFIFPGSGGVIDVLNGISYIIEGSLKQNKEDRDALYLLSAITFGSVILIGPLQSLIIPLKSFVNGTTKTMTPQIKQGLTIIKKNINTINSKLPSLINSSLNSKYAINIKQKWGKQITNFVNAFIKNIGSILTDIVPDENNNK